MKAIDFGSIPSAGTVTTVALPARMQPLATASGLQLLPHVKSAGQIQLLATAACATGILQRLLASTAKLAKLYARLLMPATVIGIQVLQLARCVF